MSGRGRKFLYRYESVSLEDGLVPFSECVARRRSEIIRPSILENADTSCSFTQPQISCCFTRRKLIQTVCGRGVCGGVVGGGGGGRIIDTKTGARIIHSPRGIWN